MTDVIAKTNIALPPPGGPYDFNVYFDHDLHDVAFSFCKATYLVKINIFVMFNTLITVESLLDMGAGLNLIDNDFLPRACKSSLCRSNCCSYKH